MYPNIIRISIYIVYASITYADDQKVPIAINV